MQNTANNKIRLSQSLTSISSKSSLEKSTIVFLRCFILLTHFIQAYYIFLRVTVSSKIIRTLEIIRVKKLIPNLVL